MVQYLVFVRPINYEATARVIRAICPSTLPSVFLARTPILSVGDPAEGAARVGHEQENRNE